MNKLKLLIFVLPIFLFSCGEEEPSIVPSLNSSFSATVSGDITSSFDGEANFVQAILSKQPTGENLSGLIIYLENKNNTDEVIFLSINDLGNTSGITEGTYNFDALSTNPQIISTNTDPDVYYLFPVDGTTNQVIITSITDTSVKGSYEFTITGVPLGGVPGQITIKGTFDAIGVTERD